MKTKKIRTKQKFNNTRKKQFSVDILRTFLSRLKERKHEKCKISKNCITPKSKSGQKILICKKYVYKSPPEQLTSKFSRIELENTNTIKIDNFNMNLLIQTVINRLPESIRSKVEHYNELCSIKDTYLMQSDKFGFTTKKHTYNSLEDYLLKNQDIDVDLVCKWLKQISEILNILYKKIQFHHADTKATQIFLTNTGNAILGDLDKVTFTLNINNKPYRIRLTHLPYTNYMQNIISDNKIPEKFHLLSEIEKLRFENKPRNNPDLEIATFIASCAILSRTQILAEEIINKTKTFYKNYKIVLPDDISKINMPTSLRAAANIVFPIKKIKYSSKLYSTISLISKKNSIILK